MPSPRTRKAKARVLLIEDSRDQAQLVRLTLQKARYQVFSVPEGGSGLKLARKLRPDLVILDLGLSDMDGFDVLRSLRAESRVPVIILTGSETEVDCIIGLKLGADEYLTKPISMPVLAARVESVLRRFSVGTPQTVTQETRGALRLDSRNHEVLSGGKTLALEPKEFHILRLLLEAHGRVVGRREMLQQVWGYSKDLGMDQRMVDQSISRLRRKLKGEGHRIVTVPTLGYKIKL